MINVELIPLVQLHIIWKWKHPLEVATKTSLRSKKILKTFEKNWSECNKIGMSISSTATNFVEVGARFSLKVASKDSFTGKETLKT